VVRQVEQAPRLLVALDHDILAVDHHQALVHGLQDGLQLMGQVGEVQLARDQRVGGLPQLFIVAAQLLARLLQAPVLAARKAHQVGRIGEDRGRAAAQVDRLPRQVASAALSVTAALTTSG
jgi:hypothetical protein